MILRLGEFVLQCLEELGIDFVGEGLDVLDHSLQFFLLHACALLHLTVPSVDPFDGLSSQYQ